MTVQLQSGLLGRDHYAEIYEKELAAQAEWLASGAVGKVDSIQQLLRRVGFRPKVLMELGAGTGAVISECRRRRLARDYVAVDYAAAAVRYMRNVQQLRAEQADITDPAARLPVADAVVLSHVLEHLEDPASFLQALRDRINCDYAVLEVPLEDLPLCRLKALVRDRSKNTAGHVQFFTGASFDHLVRRCGFQIVARRRYVAIPTLARLRSIIARDGLPQWYLPIFCLTRIFGPAVLGPLWSRLNYAHYAVICVRA